MHTRRYWALTVMILLLGVVHAALFMRAQTGDSGKRAASSTADDEILRRIDLLIGSRRYQEADRLFEDHLAVSSPATAYLRMGKAYFDHGEWSRSVPFLQKSIQLASGNDQTHLLLGLAWRELKKPDDAEAELATAAKLNPGGEVDAYMAGHQLLIDGKYEAALAYFYKAVALNPRSAASFRALGMDQARLGNYGLAEGYYRKAVEVAGAATPDASAARIDLAFLLLLGHDREHVSEGLKYAQEAAHLQPSSADAHYLTGKALLRLGRARDALLELVQAEKLNPDDSKPHFLLAQAFDRLGESQKANEERKAVIRIRQRSARAGTAGGDFLPQDSD